jgi:hypothetical protein
LPRFDSRAYIARMNEPPQIHCSYINYIFDMLSGV